MIRLMLVQWRKSIFFVTDSTTTLCMYLCTTTTTFSKNLYFDKSKKHIQQTELSKSSCKFKQEVMLIVHLLLKSVCRHVWSRIGKKNLFCFFGPAYCKCFMLLFLQYILEFETRITKDTAAENLKRSCHICSKIYWSIVDLGL